MERQANRHHDRSESIAFTYQWYGEYLTRLREAGYDFRTFDDRLGAGDVVLRHDVDLSLEAAMTTARIEADRGVEATYCVLVTSPLYNPLDGKWRDRVRALEALGHDVGLHFSTHEYWDGSDHPREETIEKRVADEKSVLGQVTSSPPETVSFHIPPEWVLDRPFEHIRSTYAPAVFSDIGYVADSGQRWRNDPPVIGELPETVQILTHPGLWAETDDDFRSRVEQRIAEACSHATRKATREFLDGGDD